jgi:fructose-bisphosphate aldolase class II
MLASLKEVLQYAEKNNCAIGAFNTPTLENIVGVIQTAEKLNQPVIIAHAQLHEPVAHLAIIGPVMVMMAKKAKVKVCVHLDHAGDFDYIKQAIAIGFTSVMYDGSLLPYEENAKNTKEVVDYAHAHHVDVEAEIGALPSREGGSGINPSALYTDPDLAVKFVKDTGIDALAASFGTAHGIYKEKPKLDFDRIEKIHKLIKLPLVMHGGSGVPEEDVKRSISLGIKKVNYYSYMSREGVFAAKKLLAEQDVTFYHDIADAAYKAMMADCEIAMKVFMNR